MTISKLKFFLIWGTISLIILGMEWLLQYYFHILNLTPLYFEFLFLLTFMGLYIFRAVVRNNPIKKENMDIAIRLNAILDSGLSKRYTALTEHFTHVPVEIYKFPALGKYISPAFMHIGKNPAIFIYENFFNNLDDNEREALVLHEIYHFIKKDGLKTYIFQSIMYTLGGVFLFSLVVLLLSGFHFFIYIFAIVALSGSVIVLLILIMRFIYKEKSADTFAAKTMGTNIPVISVVNKAYGIVIQHHPNNRKIYNAIYHGRKINLEKKTHLNGANESKASK